MLLEKAFWIIVYGLRAQYFRYGRADRRYPSTVWILNAYPASHDAPDKVVKICDVKQRPKSEPFVRLMPPSFASLEVGPGGGFRLQTRDARWHQTYKRL